MKNSRNSFNRRGFSVLELAVTIALGIFIALITSAALRNAVTVFTNASGRDAATRDLMRARRALENELILASLEVGRFQIAQANESYVGKGADGDAVNFLSAVNATNGEVETLADGSFNPYYFQNVCFFPSIPTNHSTLYGSTCAGFREAGYEVGCPHKVLLRSVQNTNPDFTPTDPTTQDTLLTFTPPYTGFMARPTGFPRTSTLHTLAANILTFRAQRIGGEIQIDLRAVSLQDARTKVPGFGAVSLAAGGYTIINRFSVFPKN
jgi:hypothetical protein